MGCPTTLGGGLQGGREEHGLRVTHLLSYAAPPYAQEGSRSTDGAGSMINRAAAVGHWPLGTLKTRPGHPGRLGRRMPSVLTHLLPEPVSTHGWTVAPESESPLVTPLQGLRKTETGFQHASNSPKEQQS